MAPILKVAGILMNGQSQASADKYNASIAEQNSTGALEQAQASAIIQQETAKRQIGATVAAYGASGIAMEGTPLDVLANSASVAERDRQTVLYKGQLQAAGYQDQAQLDRAAASNALTQSWFSAAGSLADDASKAVAMGA